jgi:hypothetical protein
VQGGQSFKVMYLVFHFGSDFCGLGESPSAMNHSYPDGLDIPRGDVLFFFQPGEDAVCCFTVVLRLHRLGVNGFFAL